jgi:very-short-patch-repair endonuclease
MTTIQDYLRDVGGVARVSQLRGRGATTSDIRAAIASGALVRIRKGWLHTPDAAPELIRAVALGGRLACLSAARYLGLWTPESTEVLHIARPAHAGHTFGDASDCEVHWQSTNWSATPGAIEQIDAIIRQVLLCCEYEDALAIVDSALNQRLLTLARLTRLVASLPPRFSSVLDDVDPECESGLETYCRYRLTQLGLPIRTQVTIDGVGRVDVIVGDRLIVEADGKKWHDGAAAFVSDRTRDLALVRMGYIVIRVAYEHVTREWHLVELAVRALVERGDHLWSKAHRREGLHLA